MIAYVSSMMYVVAAIVMQSMSSVLSFMVFVRSVWLLLCGGIW